MTRKEKPLRQQPIYDPLLAAALEPDSEGDSPSIIAGFVKAGISPLQLEIPGSDITVVKCGMCKRDMWTVYYNEETTFVCKTCSNEFIPR
jgi:uncharacterized CHY-type Zn-finger protein